jgi:hypothetical protein
MTKAALREPPEGERSIGIEIDGGEVRWFYGPNGETSFNLYWRNSESGDIVLTLEGPWLDAIGGNVIQAYEDVFKDFGGKLHQALIAVDQLREDTAARLKAERGEGGSK